MCFVSNYCLSNNGAIARKQQSSCFFPPSLCRTKHQAPQESTLLLCCCITELSSGHRRQWPQPPLREQAVQKRGWVCAAQFDVSSIFITSIPAMFAVNTQKRTCIKSSRTWGGAEGNLGSNSNLLWQKL